MESTLRRTWSEIDLDALIYNYRTIKEKIGKDVKFLGVVKADAYGHGSINVAKTLEEEGADYLAVSSIDEAMELRINGIKMPRSMNDQSKLGQAVTLSHDAVTGEEIISDIMPGDILFLRSPQSAPGSEVIYEEAVCTDTGTLLMISPAATTIRLKQFKSGDDITNRIITIRRVFATR